MNYEEIYDIEYCDQDDIVIYKTNIEALEPGSTIIEIGVGTGRIPTQIEEIEKYNYIGIEYDSSAIDALRNKKVKGLKIIEGSFPSCLEGNARVDLIIFPFNGISYIQPMKINSFFEGASSRLNCGDVFLFDMLAHNSDYIKRSFDDGSVAAKTIESNGEIIKKISRIDGVVTGENWIAYQKKFEYLNKNNVLLCSKNFDVTVYRFEYIFGVAMQFFSNVFVEIHANFPDRMLVRLVK